MMSFQQFCMSKTTRTPFKESDNVIIEEKYIDILDVTIKNLKNKREIFGNINIPYIENAINDEALSEKILNKIPNGDIPDSIIKRLSEGIFKCKPTELNVEQQSIIKIVAIYICISI